MADVKLAFGTSTGITVTLASLAAAAARECTAIDNSTNKFLDAQVYLALALQTGTPAAEKAIYVWFYGSEDGTNYTDNATGTDNAVTMRSPTNLRGPFTIATPDSGALTYKAFIPSVAKMLGALWLPRKWGLVIENQTNLTFNATEGNHTKTYTGLYQTVT